MIFFYVDQSSSRVHTDFGRAHKFEWPFGGIRKGNLARFWFFRKKRGVEGAQSPSLLSSFLNLPTLKSGLKEGFGGLEWLQGLPKQQLQACSSERFGSPQKQELKYYRKRSQENQKSHKSLIILRHLNIFFKRNDESTLPSVYLRFSKIVKLYYHLRGNYRLSSARM